MPKVNNVSLDQIQESSINEFFSENNGEERSAVLEGSLNSDLILPDIEENKLPKIAILDIDPDVDNKRKLINTRAGTSEKPMRVKTHIFEEVE